MQTSPQATGERPRIVPVLTAIVVGIVVAMLAANVWPILLLSFGVPIAAVMEILFLAAYLYWMAGGWPPTTLRAFRERCFRSRRLARREWLWGLAAAVFFAATIHASIVLLFRFSPYPAEAFHRGYDFSFIPSHSLQWLACILSAVSAGICEETGFRGYMQRPIENRIGPAAAIFVSSLFFTLVHLNKSWALIGMVPIIFGAGLLLGWLARASASLIFGMIGHVIMDIGLFAYWWTQIAGVFPQRPISRTGLDYAFGVECAAFGLSLWLTAASIRKLSRIQNGRQGSPRKWEGDLRQERDETGEKGPRLGETGA
jgi:membrane protease YdiL (CAAX protease family)